MDVRIVMDDGYIKKFSRSFTRADKQGEMHDKFCIIDHKIMFTGSANPTNNDAHKNNNNVLVINIPSLIENYEDEFQELWNGTFKSGKAVQTPLLFIQNTTIQNYSAPKIIALITFKANWKKQSNRSILWHSLLPMKTSPMYYY